MIQHSKSDQRILAIDPTTKGFGFAVLEGPDKLVEWGTKEVNGSKNGACINEIEEIIRLYQPTVIVVENCDSKHSRRSERVRELIANIGKTASAWGLRVCRVSMLAVKKLFSAWSAANKYEIAKVIAQLFVELALRLPPKRAPWMSEDERYAIFDAIAFALTYFKRQRSKRKHEKQN